jgi:hypothetical protein
MQLSGQTEWMPKGFGNSMTSRAEMLANGQFDLNEDRHGAQAPFDR